jgi:hypothetical protein
MADMKAFGLWFQFIVLAITLIGCVGYPTPTDQARTTFGNSAEILEGTWDRWSPMPSPTSLPSATPELTLTAQAMQAVIDEAARRRAEAEAELEKAHLAQTQQAYGMTAEAREGTVVAAAQATDQAQRWAERTAMAGDAQATSTAETGLWLLGMQATGTAAGFARAEATAQAHGTLDAAAFLHTQALRGAQETETALAIVRAERVNGVLAWWEIFAYPVLFCLITTIGIWLYWFWKRNQVVSLDERGMAPVLVTNGKVTWPERMSLATEDPQRPALLSPEAQMRTVENAQKVQGLRQVDPRKREVVRVMDSHALTPAEQNSACPSPGDGMWAARVDWRYFVGFTGAGLPLGVGEDGRVMAQDLDSDPHRLVAGKTGGGKSRYGIRPMVAGALGRGFVVASLSETAPVDLRVFEGHENYYRLQVDDPNQAMAYMEGLLQEVHRRMDMLYETGATTWGRLLEGRAGVFSMTNAEMASRAYGPRVMVVIDEYVALADAMEGNKNRFQKITGYLSRMARKAGVHLVLGVQNPTRESVKPNIRRNMVLQSFAMVDAQASRAVLEIDGAERLQGAQYMALMTAGIQRGIGFDPSDREILDYLERTKKPAIQTPVWVREVMDAMPGRPSTASSLGPGSAQVGHVPLQIGFTQSGRSGGRSDEADIAKMGEEARALWEEGASKSEIARALGLATGGSDWAKVSRVVEYLEGSSSTGSSTDEDGGEEGV